MAVLYNLISLCPRGAPQVLRLLDYKHGRLVRAVLGKSRLKFLCGWHWWMPAPWVTPSHFVGVNPFSHL